MDFKEYLGNARQFKKASERLFKPNNLGNDKFEMYPMQGWVCLAFSVELYLKVLLIKEGRFKKKHNLFDLFEILKQTTKDELIKRHGSIPFFFTETLKQHAEAFEEFRYLDIKTGISYNGRFMDSLIITIESYIKEKY